MAYKQELRDGTKRKRPVRDEEIHMAKETGLNPKSLIKIFQAGVGCGKPL